MRKRFAVNTVKIVYLKKRDSYRPDFIHIKKLQIDIYIVQNHENGFLLQKFVEKCLKLSIHGYIINKKKQISTYWVR